MVPLVAIDPSVQLLAYVAAFSIAALACLASVRRARHLDDPDTRRGITWLLLTSAGWAGAHVGYLSVPSVAVATGFHVVGLVLGIAAVGAWLYFCSAYTGRRLHRNPRIQRLAIVVFLGFIALKVTNPLHGLYFSTTLAAEPFPHVAMAYGRLHWIVTALSYALAAVGYFMLFELFLKAGHRTRALSVIVALTGLPVLLNLAADATDLLVDIGYEPLGVAAFAVGVFYVFADRFEIVRLAGGVDTPVVYLDADGAIQDYNDAAADLFPGLVTGQGGPLGEAVPALADLLEADEPVIELESDGRRYYRLSTNRFTLGQSDVGQVLILSDVTEAEVHRQELERQNARLERFAGVVSHDLRNPLNVASSRLELAREERDDEHLEAADAALDRMAALIEDVLTLARQGQSIGETEPVSLSGLVDRTRDAIDLGEASLTVTEDLRFVADEDRARQLLENLVRNAIQHGGPGVDIRVGATADGRGFFVADDGPGIPADEREDIFDAGYSTHEAGTGFGLAIVSEIVEAHGWEIHVEESEIGGARFEITGLERQRAGEDG